MKKTAGSILGAAHLPLVVAVVGCRGKSTWIDRFANEFCGKKVLITPTTKIMLPDEQENTVCKTLEECNNHTPAAGIQYMGIQMQGRRKLASLPLDDLERIAPQYDVVLMEADGSAGLPCKGWNDREPVIPAYCTHTVGIVTLDALGLPVGSQTVLRIPEFAALTGLHEGGVISLQTLTTMLCGAKGMFHNSRGKQMLFINKAEDAATATQAEEWLRDLKAAYPGKFAALAYGSARQNQWTETLPKPQQ